MPLCYHISHNAALQQVYAGIMQTVYVHGF